MAKRELKYSGLKRDRTSEDILKTLELWRQRADFHRKEAKTWQGHYTALAKRYKELEQKHVQLTKEIDQLFFDFTPTWDVTSPTDAAIQVKREIIDLTCEECVSEEEEETKENTP